MNKTFDAGTIFIWQNARALERAIFEYRFSNGSSARILQILHTYQNDDGGFGHALEPDLRCPDSQPLFVEFGLRTLFDSRLRAAELASDACEFLSSRASLESGIPLIFPSAKYFPHADHMDGPYSSRPSMERLTSLVGLLAWQGISHPWLGGAVEACLAFIEKTKFTDAHTILNAFCLLEVLSEQHQVDKLFSKLSADLFHASYFNLDAQTKAYGLTPLTFTPTPTSYCRRLFTGAQIETHLDALERQQEMDGGWPIHWNPPDGSSRLEWRAYKTVTALTTLRAYGRL